jgi:ATP-binding cassette, subfamily C (CFTR/MRP), member 1
LTAVQVTTLAFLALQLSILIRYSLESPGVFDIQLFSSTVSSIAALAFCVLSVVEHRRSATPSTFLVLYILACAFGHASELLVLPPNHNKEALSFLIFQISLELAVLVAECQNKDSILLPQYQQLTPEERAGILGRTFFWWINPFLMKGHRSILTDDDLPRTGEELSSSKMRRNILRAWDRRGLWSSGSPISFVPTTNFEKRQT